MASYNGLADAFGATPTSALPGFASPNPEGAYQLTDLTLETRSASLGYNPDFNASAILARTQQYQLQVIATTFSTISILAAICAIFWFCMMRRNFRRDLVLLLILGDCWKSAWFLVFSITTLIKGHIYTGSSFCQASGYFLQLGLETCDVSILLMSMHMMFQIFPPKNSILGGDGLYRVRYYVLAGWVIVPNILTAIAFSNTGPAFVSQGGFCSLPVRPIWFRLALSWIPRYLIWIFVFGVAIRIYRHVGYEFKVFGQENDQSSSVGIPDHSPGGTSDGTATQRSAAMQRDMSSQSDSATVEKQPMHEDDIAPDDDSMSPPRENQQPNGLNALTHANPNRRQSVPSWASPFGNVVDPSDLPLPGPIPLTSRSTPTSRRGSRQVAAGYGVGAEDFGAMPLELARPRGSVSTMASRRSGGEHSSDQGSAPGLAPITEHKTTTIAIPTAPGNVAARAMQGRRQAIQRQLRLLFIYPVMYLLLWMFPFIAHCFNYSNYYAQHPFFALTVLSIFCQNIMGFCDVCVFCWREKPWRHIPGSDGTFLGSFLFWRYAFSQHWAERRKSQAFVSDSNKEKSTGESSQTGLLGSIKRWSMSLTGQTSVHRPSNASVEGGSATTPPRAPRRPVNHRRTRSGGSDRRVLQAELAQERLARERAEYEQNRRSLQERRTSAVSATQNRPQSKEWWDKVPDIPDDLDDDDGQQRHV